MGPSQSSSVMFGSWPPFHSFINSLPFPSHLQPSLWLYNSLQLITTAQAELGDGLEVRVNLPGDGFRRAVKLRSHVLSSTCSCTAEL